MSFLNPFLLLGLLAVAVPLLIHLVNLRRPDRVPFSTLAFFEALKTSTLRQLRMKRWLLLAMRMLAILMLAVALAGPFIPPETGISAEERQSTAVGILIDNSPSMGQLDRQGPFLDQAKRVAEQIISGRRADDRILIEVTHGAQLNWPPLASGAALDRLVEISVLNQGYSLPETMSRLINRLDRSGHSSGQLHLITDGSSHSLNRLAETPPAGSREYRLYSWLVGDELQQNVAVTSVDLVGEEAVTDQPVRLAVTVENFGASAVDNHFLSLYYQEEVIGEHRVGLEAGESASYEFEIVQEEDVHLAGYVQLEGDDLIFDNRRYFSVGKPEQRSLLMIAGQEPAGDYPSYLSRLLEVGFSDSTVLEVETVQPGSALPALQNGPDAVILDGVRQITAALADDLVHFIQEGGGVLFLPSANGDLASYNRFLEQTGVGRFTGIEGSYGSFEPVEPVAAFREGHPLLTDLFELEGQEDPRVNLPELYYYYELQMTEEPGRRAVLETERGHPVLAERIHGQGRLIVSSIGTDPGWSDFPVKPLFAPLFHRVVTWLSMSERGRLLEHTLGQPFRHRIEGTPEEVTVRVDGQELVPARRMTHQGLEITDEGSSWEPGLLTVEAAGDETVIAVNQHTMESDFKALERQAIVDLLQDHFDAVEIRYYEEEADSVAEVSRAAGFGRELWYWFILAALLLLTGESIVSRLYRAESIR